jgi:hypothetical protein
MNTHLHSVILCESRETETVNWCPTRAIGALSCKSSRWKGLHEIRSFSSCANGWRFCCGRQGVRTGRCVRAGRHRRGDECASRSGDHQGRPGAHAHRGARHRGCLKLGTARRESGRGRRCHGAGNAGNAQGGRRAQASGGAWRRRAHVEAREGRHERTSSAPCSPTPTGS